VGADDHFLFFDDLTATSRRGDSQPQGASGVVVLGVDKLETGLFQAFAKILKVDWLVDRYPHDIFQSYESSLTGQEK